MSTTTKSRSATSVVLGALGTFSEAVDRAAETAFESYIGAGVDAWESIKDVYAEAFAERKAAKPTMTRMTVGEFNAYLASEFKNDPNSKGRKWTTKDSELARVIIWRAHNEKVRAAYTVACGKAETVPELSGYLQYLRLVDAGRLTEAGSVPKAVKERQAKRENERKAKAAATVFSHDFTTLLGKDAVTDVDKVVGLMKVRHALEQQLESMLQGLTPEDRTAARKAFSSTLKKAAGIS